MMADVGEWGDEEEKRKGHHRNGFGMRLILIAVLMVGAVLSGISSCATVPKPLVPGELRLLRMRIPETQKIRLNIPFVLNFIFEADGEPEIKSACFYFAGDGPHCFRVTDVNYGLQGTIKVQILTHHPGAHFLKGYVVYIRDGKAQATNMVSTYLSATPQ